MIEVGIRRRGSLATRTSSSNSRLSKKKSIELTMINHRRHFQVEDGKEYIPSDVGDLIRIPCHFGHLGEAQRPWSGEQPRRLVELDPLWFPGH